MGGNGDGRGEHLINLEHERRSVRAGVLAILLAACSSEEPAQRAEQLAPDASLASELACPGGVITWRDALIYWDELRCTATARCFPEKFAEWYGDQAGCMAALGAWHCKGGTPANWCDLSYPRERCAELSMCRDDAEAISCDPDVEVPASCEEALR